MLVLCCCDCEFHCLLLSLFVLQGTNEILINYCSLWKLMYFGAFSYCSLWIHLCF